MMMVMMMVVMMMMVMMVMMMMMETFTHFPLLKLEIIRCICQHRIKTSEVQKNDRHQTELQLYLNSWLHGTFCAKYNALVRILQCHFFAGKQYFTHPQTSRASKSISCLWDPP